MATQLRRRSLLLSCGITAALLAAASVPTQPARAEFQWDFCAQARAAAQQCWFGYQACGGFLVEGCWEAYSDCIAASGIDQCQ